jgi:hypothetical protein
MNRFIAAFLLTGFAASAFAQHHTAPQGSSVPEFNTIIVQNADSCPPGYYPSVPSYQRMNGRFVENGWACKSLYSADRY